MFHGWTEADKETMDRVSDVVSKAFPECEVFQRRVTADCLGLPLVCPAWQVSLEWDEDGRACNRTVQALSPATLLAAVERWVRSVRGTHERRPATHLADSGDARRYARGAGGLETARPCDGDPQTWDGAAFREQALERGYVPLRCVDPFTKRPTRNVGYRFPVRTGPSRAASL